MRSALFISSLSVSTLVFLMAPSWASSPRTPNTLEIGSDPISPEFEFVPEPLEAISAPESFSWSFSPIAPLDDPTLCAAISAPEQIDLSPQCSPLSQNTETPQSTQPIEVNEIRVTGSTIFSQEQLKEIVANYEGKSQTLDQLREAADKITELYLNGGYINSRAILGDQVVDNGVIEIQVIEGRLEDIVVEGAGRLNPSYITSRIRRMAGVPLNSASLENQLRLLKTDPLFESVEASLQPGSGIGQSKLTVRVSLKKPLTVNLFTDNYSPASVGSERIGFRVGYQNLSGLGDRATIGYNRTTNNAKTSRYEFAYRIPINAMDGSLSIQFLPDNNEISNIQLQDLGIRGETQRYEFDYRQPLIRSPRQEFALSLGFSHHRGQTFLGDVPFGFGSGPDDRGRTRSSAIRFGQEYLRRDANGILGVRSQFYLGIDAFGATLNPGSTPDSRFFSWLLSLQRLQRLGDHHLLTIRGDLQLATTSLLPSRQYVIGGGQSVRGYRQNARSGDNGFLISIEDRITIQRDTKGQPTLMVAPFVDLGQVWNSQGNPNVLASENFLMGVGVGLLWEVAPGWNIRLDYGYPLIDLPDRGNNAQDDGFYFSVNVEL
ncbi:ShlB/FhaC/HecB family hemolysin secretion/activation protein [Roseofilum reptotaenium]|nr:ShlB/FhaC/HecB family hemolysin secretion/activation protein [Roseofilum reptotaenium]